MCGKQNIYIYFTINNGSFHVYFGTQPPKHEIGLDY